MKLIIAGGRNYHLTAEDYEFLALLYDVTEVITGGATGADHDGEMWAIGRDIPTIRVAADWSKHGKAAGPIRNRQMAYRADAVVLFPGGRGTESMAKEARDAGITIFDRRAKG